MRAAARVAIVTGASAGIGKACAEQLAAAGWTVTGASRRGTAGSGWTGLVMDVDDDQAVLAGVGSVIEREGRIDALVAAAGWGIAGAAESTTIAEAKAQLETNFWGCVRAVQAVLPQMRAQRGGRIVLISSIGGVIGVPFQAYYSASKFALEGFAEAVAYEVAPFGVHITLVQPGNIATDFTASRTAGQGRRRRLRLRCRDEKGRVADGARRGERRTGGAGRRRRPAGAIRWPAAAPTVGGQD